MNLPSNKINLKQVHGKWLIACTTGRTVKQHENPRSRPRLVQQDLSTHLD